MKKKFLKLGLVSTIAVLMTACGGGGGDDTPPAPSKEAT